ncbi:MAG: S8 family serine peptidase, partial [Actinomycetes bacterium]
VMAAPSVSGRVVVGDVEEDQIAALRDAGLFIYRVDPDSGPRLPEAVAVPPARPRASSAGGPLGLAPPEPQLPASTDVYLVAVAGSLLPAWAEVLAAAGGEVLERVTDSAYTCRIRLDDVGGVRDLPFVSDLRLFRGEDTFHVEQQVRRAVEPRPGRAGTFSLDGEPGVADAEPGVEEAGPAEEATVYDLVLHALDGANAVRRWLADHDVPLVGAGGRKFRIRIPRGSAELAELARRPEIAAIDEWVPPTLSNDHARVLLGVAGSAGTPPLKWTGKGQRVGVADSGIDADHPDLAARVAKTFALGVAGDASDRHGHGTHVAGSIAGDGPDIKGTASEAELIFQSVMDASGGLGGLPVDLGELFEQARENGAHIHNNSWGALAGGAYRATSLEVDTYVHEHPDVLVVIAAGNNATAFRPRNTQPGFVDLFSVDAPATAKNALTVGASRSDRVRNPPLTWGVFDDRRFSVPPIADGLVTGDPTGIAAFSGRGPCQEQTRIKPDVVAPGTFILSTRASTAPAQSFWGLEDDERYAYMGGTSMATPLVSGCAALTRQYLVEDRNHQPSAALLKAILVNGTRWLAGPDAVADHRFEPNFHQGFGIVDLRTTLPGSELKRLEFADHWADDAAGLAFTGDSRTFVVTSNGGPLRMCLAWTDLPGRGVQNSLALLVRHDGTGERSTGNPRRKKEFDTDDAGNNVQVIRWDDAPPGSYVVQIAAANLLPPRAGQALRPQHFAFVVSGDLASGLTAL